MMTVPYPGADDYYSLMRKAPVPIEEPEATPVEQAKSPGSYRLARRLQRRDCDNTLNIEMQGLLSSAGFRDRPAIAVPQPVREPCETMESRLTRSQEEYRTHVQNVQVRS